jgi:hypothetical protein
VREVFYERMGFRRFPFVLDGGVSGEEGRHPGGIWLVKNLEQLRTTLIDY